MTLVLGYTHLGIDYIVSDCLGSDENSQMVYENNKVFRKENMLIGGAGSFRPIQLVEFGFKLPPFDTKTTDYEYMMYKLSEKLIDFLDNRDAITKGEDGSSCDTDFLFVFRHKIYIFQSSDLSMICPQNSFAAIGDGSDYAHAVMSTLKYTRQDDDPSRMLRMTVDLTSQYVPSVGGGSTVLSI